MRDDEVVRRLLFDGHFRFKPPRIRILGCLLEKERITPENYPLSLNSLIAACNQSTNRDPITSYDGKIVERGLESLREKKFATVVFGAGTRVQKYRHNLLDHFNLERHEIALLCVLLLRGPQTPGELRARTERMHHFSSLEEVESSLESLLKEDSQFVRVLPAAPGQKEKRYIQLLSGETKSVAREEIAASQPSSDPAKQSRIDLLENEVAALKQQVERLTEELAVFRQQFE